MKSSGGAAETGQDWTLEYHQGLVQRLLLSFHNIFTSHKNVHNQKTQRHRDGTRIPGGEGTSERRGVCLPLCPLPIPESPSINRCPQASSRSLSWGRRQRQTDSNPSESRKFQVARSEQRGCSESRRPT